MMSLLRAIAASLFLAGILSAADLPTPAPWPMDIPVSGGVITLYQPQPERLEGTVLTARAAASYLASGKSDETRVFGALWFTAKLDIDREHDVARAREMTITKVVTPKGEKTGDEGAAAKKAIQDAVLAQGMEIDLDRLIATLEEPGSAAATGFNDAVPRILIRHQPTVLVVCDGEPQLRETGGIKRLVNTPGFLVVDPTGTWWLRGANDWLTAPALTGPWTIPSARPPAGVVEAAKKAGFPTDVARAADATAPAVIVVNEATELIVFEGKPAYVPIGDGALLGATNGSSPALVEVATGRQWLMLAGRWYSSARLADDAMWTLITPDRLPAAFAALPTGTPWEDLRVHVAGTPEADVAAAQQQIPQTARIPRSATITVAYDGEPAWLSITGREVAYAQNSADAVFRIPGPSYFACRDGVWYESKDAHGPFRVATSVPDGLRNLPADCPWHNCSYVQVYESTTEYVWCGYTPGYLGWYSWYGCPVYGTGYWYHGWYGPAVVYPRPVTWGVGISWSSSGGWGIAVGVGGPHWSIAIGGGGHGGWYGCGGVNTISIDRSTNISINNRPSQQPVIYNRVAGAERPQLRESGDRLRGTTAEGQPPARPAQGPARENLAVDRDGTIGRPAGDGSWQVREGGGWKDRKPEAKPAPKPAERPRPTASPQPQTRPAPSFEQTQRMRSQGEQRVQQRAAPSRAGGRRR